MERGRRPLQPSPTFLPLLIGGPGREALWNRGVGGCSRWTGPGLSARPWVFTAGRPHPAADGPVNHVDCRGRFQFGSRDGQRTFSLVVVPDAKPWFLQLPEAGRTKLKESEGPPFVQAALNIG